MLADRAVRSNNNRLWRCAASAWPHAELLVRDDIHYRGPEVLDLCRARGVDFILLLEAMNATRLTALRDTVDSGASAATLPVLSVASLVGFGAVVAELSAFGLVRDWVLGIGGGPQVSLAVAVNILTALTGSASGGMTIALDALRPMFMGIAYVTGIDPGMLHRVAVTSSGRLDSLPHNGAVVTMLAVCGCTHHESCLDVVIVAVVKPLLALAAVIALGTACGSF